MTIRETFETYSKSAKVITAWFLERMLSSLDTNSIPDEFKEVVRQQGLPHEKVHSLVEVSPRALFDLFDHYKIYIVIIVDETGGFWWWVNDVKSSIGYEYRKNAEFAAITEAFKLLEEKL
jgi:hypothetical protein